MDKSKSFPTEQYYDIWQQSMDYMYDRVRQKQFVNDGIWFVYETLIETEE